jgi:hypothetical protein
MSSGGTARLFLVFFAYNALKKNSIVNADCANQYVQCHGPENKTIGQVCATRCWSWHRLIMAGCRPCDDVDFTALCKKQFPETATVELFIGMHC